MPAARGRGATSLAPLERRCLRAARAADSDRTDSDAAVRIAALRGREARARCGTERPAGSRPDSESPVSSPSDTAHLAEPSPAARRGSSSHYDDPRPLRCGPGRRWGSEAAVPGAASESDAGLPNPL